MSVEELKSAKGKPLFVVQGFVYVVDKKELNRYYCSCLRYKTEHCTARVIIDKVCCIVIFLPSRFPMRFYVYHGNTLETGT